MHLYLWSYPPSFLEEEMPFDPMTIGTCRLNLRDLYFFFFLSVFCVWLLRKLWERIETENFYISCERFEGFGPMALRRASSCFFNKLKLNLNPNLNNVAHRNLSAGTFLLYTFIIIILVLNFFFIVYLVFGRWENSGKE